MKLNYGLVFLGVVFIIIHFSKASEEFVDKISNDVTTAKSTTTTTTRSDVPPPSNIVHEESVDVSMTVLPTSVNSTVSPIVSSSSTEILWVKHVDPTIPTGTVPPKEEIEPNVTDEKIQNPAPILPTEVVSIPSDLSRPGTLPASTEEKNHGPVNDNDVPATLPGSMEIPDSILPPSSASPVTLPAEDEFPNLIAIPPSPDIVGPLPATADISPPTQSPGRPVTLPVDQQDHPRDDKSQKAQDELHVGTSEQPPPTHPPVFPTTESPGVSAEQPSKIPQKNLPKPLFQNHDTIIAEILKEQPTGDEGPIILRPTEPARVEPVYIPAPIQCPHCGRIQPWQLGRMICTHCQCPFCGHSMTRQVRNGEGNRPIKYDEASFKKLNRPLTSKSSPSFRAEDIGQQPARTPLQYVPIQADVHLSRRDLLRRRLNHQRVSQYMKSISPEGGSQEITHYITPREPPHFHPSEEETPPLTNNNNKPEKDSFTRSEPSSGSIFQFKTLRSWLFGTTSKDEHKEEGSSQPIQSQRTGQQPTTRYFKCPFANRQSQQRY